MISALSLMVAILAVFFGPLISRANAQRQIRAAAREAWMSEFRQQATELLKNHGLRPGGGKEEFDLWVARRQSYFALRLLLAERAPQYDVFLATLENLAFERPPPGGPDQARDDFVTAAANILRRERAAIVENRGLWREIFPPRDRADLPQRRSVVAGR